VYRKEESIIGSQLDRRKRSIRYGPEWGSVAGNDDQLGLAVAEGEREGRREAYL
jgi:hypothetical protein